MASPFSTYFNGVGVSPVPTYESPGQHQPVAGPSSASTARSGSQSQPPAQADGQASTSRQNLDYYSSYGLDPSAFSTDISFQLPSFLSGPFAQPPPPSSGPSLMDANALPFAMHSPAAQTPRSPGGTLRPMPTPKPLPPYNLNLNRPVYGPYGSSVVGVQPDSRPFRPSSRGPDSAKAQGKARAEPSQGFDPSALGLPRAIGGNFPGLYSVSGFDMLGVLARVAARPNPQVNVGPVDLSTAFTVVDARRFDLPIVYASETFLSLTGYLPSEVIGRNCRFLQAPPSQTVVAGGPRTHTDSNAVYHMKAHIQSGKESQSSVINYKKDGAPFINLVTIIPISWETDEVAYYVGFQVDVVNQPNNILERMQNGTYTVNYSLVQSDRSYSQNIAGEPQVDAPIPQPLGAGVEAAFRTAPHQPQPPRARTNAPPASSSAEQRMRDLSLTPADRSPASSPAPSAGLLQPPTTGATPALIDVLSGLANNAATSAAEQEAPLAPVATELPPNWHQHLVEQCDDLVHVLSLKGSFLYVSPSCQRILEYDPSELIGKTVSELCHPADVVPIMRELKESGNQMATQVQQPGRCINILYRIKRKQSDYVWIEAQGRMHIEYGKGRKCVIFVGRQRPLYSLSRSTLQSDGGVGDNEFWAKITFDGMFLHVTPAVESLLGFNAIDMTGFSVFQLTPDNDPTKQEIEKALDRARSRQPARVTHTLRNYQGTPISVISSFYPPINDGELVTPTYAIVRICTVESENARHLASFSDSPPAARDGLFPPLPRRAGDNVFEELETSSGTSWQFELHALAKANKKLREERDVLETLLKRPNVPMSLPASAASMLQVPASDEEYISDGSPLLAPLPLPLDPSPAVDMQRDPSTDDDSMA